MICSVNEVLEKQQEEMEKKRKYREKITLKEREERRTEIVGKMRYLMTSEKHAIIKKFERNCQLLHHARCDCCRMVGLNMVITAKKGSYFCSRCHDLNDRDKFVRTVLPTWIDDDGTVRHDIPPELKGLTVVECSLIQRVSPLIPMSHIKAGLFGMQGHTCAFEQDVEGFAANVLPRLKNDVSIVKILGQLKEEIGSKICNARLFRVRRKKVETALHFLIRKSCEYSDIKIDMTRMDWMGDNAEVIFDGITIETDTMVTQNDDNPRDDDIGPARKQSVDPRQDEDVIECFGMIDENKAVQLSPEDQEINNKLQAAARGSSKENEIAVNWPTIAATAIKEYGTTRIFARAFPWLFPGGVGDVKDFNGKTIGDWGKMLNHYYDGRFVKDPHFSFYALNYIIRQRNAGSSHWFMTAYQKDVPDTLEDVQAQILQGNMKVINNITFWNKRIKGANPYWIDKKWQLYSWINYHVAAGNGAPMFFITLSCAEHYWPDVIRLIKERMELAGDDSSMCYVGSPKISQLVNDHALVIQEYFQSRVELWLETVGKEMLDIKHYWVRYEFAPGRGQIHAHLLAISSDQSIYKLTHLDLQSGGEEKRAETLSTWAEKKFGLTATVADAYNDLEVTKDNTPVSIRFTDIDSDDNAAVKKDGQALLKFCQHHECSGFCLNKKTGSKTRLVQF